jgi:NitT/TauT family transport system permease protein
MFRRAAQILVAWLAIIGAWEGAYRVVGWKSWHFPAPSHVLDATLNMLGVQTRFGDPMNEGWPLPPENARTTQSVLVSAVIVSSIRLIVGFAVSLVLGTLLGIAMWRWEFVDRLFGPVCLGLQTLPSVCWVPLAILTLGLSESAILLVLILGSCFAIAISLRDGLRTIPPIYHRAGLMLAARGWRLYRYILLPASLPAVASSLRQGFSFAWRSLMGAELIFVLQNRGLGFLLAIGRDFADVAQVVAVMIIMIVLAMIVDRWVFAQIERRVRTRFGLIAAG